MRTLKLPSRAKVLKGAVWSVVIAVAVVVLFTTVFPWVEERQQNPTIGAASGMVTGDPQDQLARSPR